MDCLEWQSILAGARPWTAGAGFNREVLSRHGRHSRLICFQGIKMLLENHYQNAYVTRDIEQALDIFRTRYGVQDARSSEENTSELQSLMRISYADCRLTTKTINNNVTTINHPNKI